MKFLIRTTTKFIYLAVFASLLFLGCKKEELTSSQWGERATAKRNEIQALASNIPCSQKDKVGVQTIQQDCSVQYFAILSSDITKYEQLKKEYLSYLNKQYEAWYKEGLIIEPCGDALWAIDQPIRLDCKNDKVQLITAATLALEEAKTLINVTRIQIDNIINAQTCTSEANWSYTRLINAQTMTIDLIPISRNTDIKELKDKISLYNRLNINVIETEKKVFDYRPEKLVDKIECVNGKPVIKYKS